MSACITAFHTLTLTCFGTPISDNSTSMGMSSTMNVNEIVTETSTKGLRARSMVLYIKGNFFSRT